MIEAVATGLLFGLSAGVAPGPLLALVVSQTVRHGLGEGLRVAAAPLLTDLPIVIGSVFLVGSLAGLGWPLVAVSFAGAAFVAFLALETWHATDPRDGTPPEGVRSWRRGALVNLLNPNPYLFWLTVGAPTLIAGAQSGPGTVAGFLVAFYATLVGSKMAAALATARAGAYLHGGTYRAVMRLLALALLGFATLLVVEGILRLGG